MRDSNKKEVHGSEKRGNKRGRRGGWREKEREIERRAYVFPTRPLIAIVGIVLCRKMKNIDMMIIINMPVSRPKAIVRPNTIRTYTQETDGERETRKMRRGKVSERQKKSKERRNIREEKNER